MCENFLKCLQGNHSAVFVTLAILLVGVSTALSTPSGKTDWWLDPCDTQMPQMRHARSANVQQIFYSINDIKQLKKKLIEIYPNSQDKVSHKLGCLKMSRLIKPVKLAANKLNATTQFYLSLTQVAMFLEKLRNIRVEHQSNKFSEAKRSSYYEKMKAEIKLVLCEASEEIFLQAPEQKNLLFSRVKKLPNKEAKCLPKKIDQSAAQMHDFNFYNKVDRFLRQSRRRFKKLTRKNGGGAKNNQRKRKRTRNL